MMVQQYKYNMPNAIEFVNTDLKKWNYGNKGGWNNKYIYNIIRSFI